MEQERSGRGGDMNKQPQQERRVKEMQQGDAQVQVQQPQKCPRCDSLNTKFCYYNNYSLSQPRYFCKACRRYWTQGGTLRNVPVGGGCRKGKRAKNSSNSSSAENSSRSQPPPPQEVVQTQPPLTTMVRAKGPSSVLASPLYHGGVGGGVGGGYLSSLAAIHSLNPSHPFDQSLNDAMRSSSSSNLGLLSGFNVGSLVPHRPIRPPPQLYGNEREVMSLYSTEQQGWINNINNPCGSGVSQHDWSQGFINSTTNASNRASDASLWSTISTTTSIGGGNSERTSATASAASASSSLVPNQWPNLSGYGPPP